MYGRFGRMWRHRFGRTAGSVAVVSDVSAGAAVESATGAVGEMIPPERALPEPVEMSAYPEQPVLLNSPGRQPARVGEVLPARQARWPLSVLRLPAVPKRAILAAGVCAGLAGPAVARHLATRLLLGRPTSAASGALEITRIVYNGPLTPQIVAAVEKALAAGRR